MRGLRLAIMAVWFMAGYLTIIHIAMGAVGPGLIRAEYAPLIYIIFPLVFTVVLPVYVHVNKREVMV